jgi:3-hydroxyacyl-[acyl-carrier-protein] dehydratase
VTSPNHEAITVSGKDFIVDPTTLDFSRITADLETIRKYNPQRFEMEHLTAVIFEDSKLNLCVGYKDVTDQEFWIRGHMPGMPLMPGVVMLEAAAQLCSYFVQKFDLLGTKMVGFGGLEDVRFRDPVVPGDRLILMCQLLKARRRRMLVSRFQGIVRESLVVEGILKGVPIPIDALSKTTPKK